MMRKYFSIIAILAILLPNAVRAQENIQFFGVNPATGQQDQNKNLKNCLFGFSQLLLISAGLDTLPSHIQWRVPPYFRDFFLMPSQYADIMNLEGQINRARNAVMAASFRCDMPRLSANMNAYYKLEAELYYLRYFVDAGGGWFSWALPGRPKIVAVTSFPGQRRKFVEDMIKNFAQIRTMDSDQVRTTFEAYFNEFEEKYKERVRSYTGIDDVWSELAAKVDELVQTFKQFGKLGGELKSLGRETGAAIAELGTSTANTVAKFFTSKGIADTILEVGNRFQICPVDGSAECKPGYQAFADTIEGILGVGSSVQNFSNRRSFEDLKIAINTQEVKKTEDMTRAEMLTRYEVLYGYVTGSGISSMVYKMGNLKKILSDPSMTSLDGVQSCAKMIRDRECK